MRQEISISDGPNAIGLCATMHARLWDSIEVAEQAAACYRRQGLFAALVLHDYLDAQYMDILSMIGRLTDAEAESVEPAFTRFEFALARLDQTVLNPMLRRAVNEWGEFSRLN
jgi:hypothetical protein